MDKKNICHGCGAPRMKGSTLCAYCLVGQIEEQAKTIKRVRGERDRWIQIHNEDTKEIRIWIMRAHRHREAIDRLRGEIAETKEILRKAVQNEDDGMA